jgi:serine protease Do
MKDRNSEPSPWYFVPVDPKAIVSMRRSNLIVIAALTFFLVGLLLVAIIPAIGHATSHKVSLKVDANPAPTSLADLKNGFANVVGPALPGVVNISSTKTVKRSNNFPDPFLTNPFFRRFFGGDLGQQNSLPQVEREHSLGSGVIVNPDGYIITNNHVIDGASDVEVFTQDKKKFKANVIGTDPRTDVAVLKINGTGFPSLILGDSSNLKVGDVVFAIGDPFGVGETATMGIVSATGRGLGGAIEHYEDFIQTDAAINPGNSGGALLNLHGDLIGINTAIITGSDGGGSQGVGFAIPINMAKNVMEQIVDHGKVIRGHLGISIQSVDADLARAFGLKQGGGALVASVTQGGPAAKAGLERGDVISELNGHPVNEPDDLSVHVAELAPGTTVQLKIFRQGQPRDISVTLGEMNEKEEAASSSGSTNSPLDGVQVQNLTPSVARDLGVSSDVRGVVITSVDPSSAAAAAGLSHGDIIQEINHKPIHNTREYESALGDTKNQSVLLLINRSGNTSFVVIAQQ